MRPIPAVAVISIVFALFTTPAGAAQSEPSPFMTIRILHTNDIHGHILPEPDIKAGWTPPPMYGGAASLATAIRRYRKAPVFGHPPDAVLYFDAGDFFQGTPEGTLTRGKAMVEMFKKVGLDAMAAGNHDFDFGPDTFEELTTLLRPIPVVAMNVHGPPDRGDFGLARQVSFKVAEDDREFRIAVIGWITDEMVSVTTASARRGLTFEKSIETARRRVDAVRDTADFVVALTHAGVNQDTVIANAVPGIHVIVGGHSHTALSPHYRSDSTGTLVVQAGSSLHDLGVLDMLFNRKTKKIVRASSRLIPLYESEFPPNPAVRRWARRLERRVGRMLDEQVATAEDNYMKAADTESVPGNLLADAMRWATGADAAFQNSFGIRADLPKGPITLRTLFTMMPFDNTIVSMTLTGSELLDLLEQSATLKRGHLQQSGVTLVVDYSRPRGERVLRAEIGNRQINPRRTYRVATNSFLAEGGDLFDTFARGVDRQDNGRNMRDVVKEYLLERTKTTGGVFRGSYEGRIVHYGPAPLLPK